MGKRVDDPELALARPASDPEDPEQGEIPGESIQPDHTGFTTLTDETTDPD